MHSQFTVSPVFSAGKIRIISGLMLPLMIFTSFPLPLVAQSPVMFTEEPLVLTPKNVQVKKGSHDLQIREFWKAFRENPADTDIIQARIFEEPLFPVDLPAEVNQDKAQSVAENKALASALTAYRGRETPEDFSALVKYLEAFPRGRWRAAVQLNLGIAYVNTGFFSSALHSFEEAWSLTKNETGLEVRNMADRALAELADLNARFGRFDRLGQLFEETRGRDINGAALAKLDGAREGHWQMVHRPSVAFRCGPYAVNNMLDASKERMTPRIEVQKLASTKQGTSLLQLKKLTDKLKYETRMVKRVDSSADWIVPSVVHWKVGHFASIVREQGGRYLIKDPTFARELWVSRAALDRETTGYALVPVSGVKEGWQAVGNDQGGQIWGKGGASGVDQDATGDGEEKHPKCPKPQKGMPVHSVFAMLATLSIGDIPVGYNPPVGPAIDFHVTYNHLEANQPGNFTFANLGASWTYNWLSYITLDSSQNAKVMLRGGGAETYNYSKFNLNRNEYASGLKSQAVLRRITPTAYERILPDGSKEVFSQADGTGRIFLTKLIDTHDNTVTLQYDANLRLTSIVDAISQQTTLTYKSNSVGNVGFYKIDKVTDPFGRFAQFTYDGTTTKLTGITDVIGLNSTFTYETNNFINKMTTPYGDTLFRQYIPAEDGSGRGLRTILPDGSEECVERYAHSIMETYYWDRKAMAMAPGDRSKAFTTHWLTNGTGINNLMQSIPLWTKKAFEEKVFFHYPGQPEPTPDPDPEAPPNSFHYYIGTSNQPDEISRVLDNDLTQRYLFTYNELGRVTKSIDPQGRQMEYLYPVNNYDLYEIRQTRNGANDFLAKFIYNDKHLPVTAYAASGHTTDYTYNNRGQILTVTNPKSEVTTLTYDVNGYLTTIDGPQSGNQDKVVLTYDGFGRVRTVSRHEGPNAADIHTLTYDYDALDRVTKVTYPDTTFEQVVYSRLDPQKMRDRLGRWTTRTYTALRQVSSERDPLGRVINYEWCRCGALQQLTDAMGRITKWSYDAQGRLIQKIFPDNTTIDYTYETRISRLKTVTDARGSVITYGYNLDNSLASTSFNPGSGVAATPDVSYTYDEDYPRILTATSSVGTTTYSYYPYAEDHFATPSNNRGRLAIMDGIHTDDSIDYNYDELGRVTTFRINGSSNSRTFTYDASGRVTQETNNLGTTTYAYVNPTYIGNRLASVTLPNGQVTNYDWFNNAGDLRLKEIENLNSSSSLLSSFSYAYNAEGMITQWTQQADTATPQRYDFGYDAANQLRSAVLKNNSTNAILRQYYYGYDAAGNRGSEQVDAAVSSGSYNNLNQLTGMAAGGPVRFKGSLNEPGTVKVNGQDARMNGPQNFEADVNLGPGTHTVPVVIKDANNNTRIQNYEVTVPSGASRTLTYDANGNTLDNGDGQTYTWDVLNRMTKITYGSDGSTEFTYDDQGRRVKIVEKNGGGSVTSEKRLVWSGLEEAEERNSSNLVTKRFYSQGQEISGNDYYYTRDHLGSVREMVDADSTVRSRKDYDAYGIQSEEGSRILNSDVQSGEHQRLFENATDTLTVNAGDTLFVYVYLESGSEPTELMLQFREGTSWEHRAYWGANSIGLGANNTNSRRPMGSLPATGQWVRLEVPASQVGMEGKTLNGVSFTLYGGTAKWDRLGKKPSASQDLVWADDQVPAGAVEKAYTTVGGWVTTSFPWSQGDFTSDFAYTGHYYHERSGLNLAPYRAYDANLGRWLSRDPIAESGGINLYGYVANSPVNYWDPLGLELVITGNPVVDAGLEGWSRASQGVVNAFTGGLFWPEEGLFYDDFNDQWEELGSDSNDCDEAFDSGMGAGRSAIATGATAGALRGLSAFGGTRLGHLLNHNRYLRIGPGRMPPQGGLPGGPKVPRISVGPQTPGGSNPHIRL